MVRDSYNEKKEDMLIIDQQKFSNGSKKNVQNIWVDKLNQMIQYMFVQIKVKVILRASLKIMPRVWVIDKNNYNLTVRLYNIRTIYILKNFKV